MNRYRFSTPRLAFGLAALAMTALTIGLAVVVPANMESGGGEARALAARKAVAAAADPAISPLRIDVVGERDRKTAFEPINPVPPKRKQAG